jgi:pimeloyl-ACP methyl ester carboxylesterase
VIGHSFGGKVALSYAERAPASLAQVWVLDSFPGAHTPSDDHEVVRVLAALAKVPKVHSAREGFVDGLLEQGLSPAIAHWLSQNLVREGKHYRLRLDLSAIGELLDDYLELDLWSVLEEPPGSLEMHLVIAERSRRLDAAARAHLGELARHARVFRHTLPNAGHWLHVDNPDGLLELLARTLA